MDLLTDPAVERKVIDRVKLKAATFGQVRGGGRGGRAWLCSAAAAGVPPPRERGGRRQRSLLRGRVFAQDIGGDAATAAAKHKVAPDVLAAIYEVVMPLTKDVQVEYLLRRLD